MQCSSGLAWQSWAKRQIPLVGCFAVAIAGIAWTSCASSFITCELGIINSWYHGYQVQASKRYSQLIHSFIFIYFECWPDSPEARYAWKRLPSQWLPLGIRRKCRIGAHRRWVQVFTRLGLQISCLRLSALPLRLERLVLQKELPKRLCYRCTWYLYHLCI